MKALVQLTVIAVAAASGTAWAHGPSRQKVEESIEVNAPPETVWGVIKDFGAFSAWCPKAVGETAQGGNEKGATRELKLASGRSIKEELKSYDAEKMSYSYKITEVDPADLPVANYSATIGVQPGASGGAKVEWSGAFYRSFMTNNPPPEQNDEAAIKGVTAVYQECLANLKKLAEAKK
jgi:hypothetical protein